MTTPQTFMPPRLSPIMARHESLGAAFRQQAGWQIPNHYGDPTGEAKAARQRLGLADLSAGGKLIVKGQGAGALLAEVLGSAPSNVGDVLSAGEAQITRLTAAKFLLLTPPGAETALATQIGQAAAGREPLTSLIDQTDGLAGVLVVGPASRELMRKLCGLPFHPEAFPNWHVAQTSFSKVRSTIIRSDLGDLPAFALYFGRAYGEYMWDVILDAGGEFDARPIGAAAREMLNEEKP